MSLFEDYFIARGRAKSRFTADDTRKAGRDCSTCIRRQFGHPDTCHEGWDRLRAGELAPCLNYTEQELDRRQMEYVGSAS